MKKKICGCILLVGLLALVGVRYLEKSPQTLVPEYIFFYAENQAEDYPTTLGAYKFAELVEERTDGRIKILVQADSALGTEGEVIKQLQFGGIDFARVSLTQLAEVIPTYNVLQMPYLYRDAAHMWQVLDGAIGDHFMKLLEDFSLTALSWYDAGARNFYNNVRPITSLEDMKGLRIRVQESVVMAYLVEQLGAIPVPLEYGAVYSGLQRGYIDGAENNWPSYESMDHYEVAKYYTVDEHTRVPELQICAQTTWNKLSKEDQAIIVSCAQESARYERELWIAREEDSAEKVKRKGTEVVSLEPEEKEKFQQAAKVVYEKYCSEYINIIDAIIETGK